MLRRERRDLGLSSVMIFQVFFRQKSTNVFAVYTEEKPQDENSKDLVALFGFH